MMRFIKFIFQDFHITISLFEYFDDEEVNLNKRHKGKHRADFEKALFSVFKFLN